MTTGRLTLRFAELIDELQTIMSLADPYLDPSSTFSVHRLIETLEGIRGAAPGRFYRAAIPQTAPLRTKISEGAYERGGVGAMRLCAEICAVWDIEPIGAPGAGTRPARALRLGGLASTVTTVRDADTGHTIARWHMEIGDAQSPGCFFHVQLPVEVPIPRLPSQIATIPVAIEFVLSELFQDEWERSAFASTPAVARWRTVQMRRYARLFDWSKASSSPTSGSPWVAFKRSRPPDDMLL